MLNWSDREGLNSLSPLVEVVFCSGVPHCLRWKLKGMVFFLPSLLFRFLTLRNFILLGRWTHILGLHYSLLLTDVWWVCMKGNKKETIIFFSPCIPNNACLKKWKSGDSLVVTHDMHEETQGRLRKSFIHLLNFSFHSFIIHLRTFH